MAYTLGTNTTGYSYPGYTYFRTGVPTQWDKYLWAQVRDKLILEAFIGGEGSGKPFITKSEFKSKRGDTIVCAMRGLISGIGYYGNHAMEGSEANLPMSYLKVYINELKNAWLDDGQLSRQRDTYNLNKVAVEALGEWLATQVEKFTFYTLYYGMPPFNYCANTTYLGLDLNSNAVKACPNWYAANSAANVITYSATDATYTASIKAAEQGMDGNITDKTLWFGPDVLEGVAAKLKVLNFKPANYKGWNGFVGFIHPYQGAQLRSNESWFQANMHAMPVGIDGNPIFSGKLANGAIGMWNNIALFESTLVHSGNISTYTDGLGSVTTLEIDSDCANVYRAIFCGAEALAIAEAIPPHIDRKTFEYGNYEGMQVSTILGMGRADFTNDADASTIVNQSTLVVSTVSPATSI